MRQLIRGFISSDHGLETVEYAVITALIIGTMVVVLASLGGVITARFADTQGVVEGVGN